MSVLIFVIFLYGLVFSLPIAVLLVRARGYRLSRAIIAELPGVRAPAIGSNSAMTHEKDGRTIRFWPLHRNSQLWRFEVENVPLARQTTLAVVASGATQRPSAPNGMQDFDLDITGPDLSFYFSASSPSDARRALKQESAQLALFSLLRSSLRLRINLDKRGTMSITLVGEGERTEFAPRFFAAIHELSEAFSAAAIVAQPRALPSGGAGPASGSPIVIPGID